MRSQRSKNFKKRTRAKERAMQIERAYFYDLIWLALLVAICILFFPFSSQAGEYQAHIAKLGKVQAQMQKLEDEIHELAKKKSHAVDATEKEEIHKEMFTAYAELRKLNDDYEETKTHIRFKHPEKGEETEHKYSRHEVQPLANFENDATLDGKLDSFLGKFHSVYGQPVKEKKEARVEVVKKPVVEKKKVVDPDDVDQPITLSK